jgi:hypothetical protein
MFPREKFLIPFYRWREKVPKAAEYLLLHFRHFRHPWWSDEGGVSERAAPGASATLTRRAPRAGLSRQRERRSFANPLYSVSFRRFMVGCQSVIFN